MENAKKNSDAQEEIKDCSGNMQIDED